MVRYPVFSKMLVVCLFIYDVYFNKNKNKSLKFAMETVHESRIKDLIPSES